MPQRASFDLENVSAEATMQQYLPLVKHIAKRYCRFKADTWEDLVQVGTIGLLKAIKYFDPARAHKASFKALATCYIRGEIRHYLRDLSSLIQMPRQYTDAHSRLARMQEDLRRELGGEPSIEDLSRRSGLSAQQICEVQRSWEACAYYESFDVPHTVEDDGLSYSLAETVPDKKYQDFVLAAEDRELICQALKHLGDTTRSIVEFVYFYDLTQKETAKRLGLTEMSVSRAMANALRQLKGLLCSEIF